MISAEAMRLYLVFDPILCTSAGAQETVEAAIAGGITCFQLRWKSGTDREIVELARLLHPKLKVSNIPLIINDRIDLAFAAGAEGVHLGVGDLRLDVARSMAGPDFIIGYSPETDLQINKAFSSASYLGIGPFFATETKADAGAALGAEEFARRRHLTPLPVVAIGGITADNAGSVMAAGADGVAVVSAIIAADNVTQASAAILAAVQSAEI